MIKRICILFICMCVILVGCGINATPTEPEKAPVEYPGNTGISINNANTNIPDIIYSTTGAENGLAGTMYAIVGTVDHIYKQGEITNYIIKTDVGELAVMDAYATMSYLPEELDGYTVDAQKFARYFPALQIGEYVKVYAEYRGFSDVIKMPVFLYGGNDYLVDALVNSAYIADIPKDTTPNTTEKPPTEDTSISKDHPLRSGHYEVGTDIPEGEYIFEQYGKYSGYVCVSTDPNQDDIVENAVFEGSYFMTVVDGQYLEVDDCRFYPADQGSVTAGSDGVLTENMYRVGIDIDPGKYKAVAENEEMGYWAIYSSSGVPFDIVDNDLFETSSYFTVKAGQYLVLVDCTATKK